MDFDRMEEIFNKKTECGDFNATAEEIGEYLFHLE